MNQANTAFFLRAGTNPLQAINDFLRIPLFRLGLYFGYGSRSHTGPSPMLADEGHRNTSGAQLP
jgi:hypothetical protein